MQFFKFILKAMILVFAICLSFVIFYTIIPQGVVPIIISNDYIGHDSGVKYQLNLRENNINEESETYGAGSGSETGVEIRAMDGGVWDKSVYEETSGDFVLSGRWFQKEVNDKPVWITVNEGAMIYFKLEGARNVDIYFTEISQLETPYYAYIIDGGEPIRQLITNSEIPIPDEGEHYICIVIDGITEREDKWYGEVGVAFNGIESTGNICGIVPKQNRIMFIGDSITEGIMTLSDNAVSNYNSATHSFPWYTAMKLGAEPYFVGFGATGIIATGSFNTNSVALDQYSISRTISQDDIPYCNLIVINTGTNDFGVESDVFIRGYQELLLKIHNRYPDVEVVCMIPFSQSHADDIRAAVWDYTWCHIVETEDWEFSYSDAGIHPDAAGAKIIAGNLAEYIEKNIKW